MTYSAYIR